MNEKYSIPEGFDPHNAVHALNGMAYFLHEYYTEGPGVYRTLPKGHHGNLIGITWINQRLTGELTEYLYALDEVGLRLPTSDEEFEALNSKSGEPEGGNYVREERGLYLVNSH